VLGSIAGERHQVTGSSPYRYVEPLFLNGMDRMNNGMLTALFYVPGTHTECLYSLMTFGIPMSDFPMTDDGLELNRKNHHKWIEMRRKVEARRSEGVFKKLVLLPSHSDVLFGRGTPIQNHRGNVNLSLLVESICFGTMKARSEKRRH
jgi:hypothetical protein